MATLMAAQVAVLMVIILVLIQAVDVHDTDALFAVQGGVVVCASAEEYRATNPGCHDVHFRFVGLGFEVGGGVERLFLVIVAGGGGEGGVLVVRGVKGRGGREVGR